MDRDRKRAIENGPKEGSTGNGVLGLVAESSAVLRILGLWASGQPTLRMDPTLGA